LVFIGFVAKLGNFVIYSTSGCCVFRWNAGFDRSMEKMTNDEARMTNVS